MLISKRIMPEDFNGNPFDIYVLCFGLIVIIIAITKYFLSDRKI